MANNARSTVHEKERWLLDRPSQWNYYGELDRPRQNGLLTTLFKQMRVQGYYSPSTTPLDGRVSLRTIVERLLERGCGAGGVV